MDIAQKRKNKAVATWLFIGVGMIIVEFMLGGITRLTGSGLSITEWKPIMGAIPPLSDADWNEAFHKYRQIAQYKYLNNHFTLSDFKFIFFWEWFHRLWARTIGVVFAIPFIFFLVKKYFNRDMIVPLIVLFILGGLQGAIGWIMVSSGVNDTDLYVHHTKLALHFFAALVLLSYTLWFAISLVIPKEQVLTDKKLHRFNIITIVILGLQLVYGAFMAGLKAGIAAPTWPTINGEWLPAAVTESSWINHPIAVHFVHRGLAYLLLGWIVAGFFFMIKAAKKENKPLLDRVARYPFFIVMLQVLLGILTVISAPKIILGHFGTYEALALAHQLVAMCLLMSLMVQQYLLRRKVE